jgi:hypothetical protein
LALGKASVKQKGNWYRDGPTTGTREVGFAAGDFAPAIRA